MGPGLLTSQSNAMVLNGSLEVAGQFATLKEYIINTAGNTNTKYCLALGLEPVALEEGAEAPEKVGEPVKWDSEEATAAWNASAKAEERTRARTQGVGRPRTVMGPCHAAITICVHSPFPNRYVWRARRQTHSHALHATSLHLYLLSQRWTMRCYMRRHPSRRGCLDAGRLCVLCM